mmetsp:Transcript_9151/g.16465  ORF Transcript_9151/g.16465 Transcript_9151/m.16465 type:complete len:203 (+) Transcript_9151:1212-1820(+)
MHSYFSDVNNSANSDARVDPNPEKSICFRRRNEVESKVCVDDDDGVVVVVAVLNFDFAAFLRFTASSCFRSALDCNAFNDSFKSVSTLSSVRELPLFELDASPFCCFRPLLFLFLISFPFDFTFRFVGEFFAAGDDFFGSLALAVAVSLLFSCTPLLLPLFEALTLLVTSKFSSRSTLSLFGFSFASFLFLRCLLLPFRVCI